MILAEYDFTITYRPGVLAIIPDVLSRRKDVYPSKGESFLEKNPNNLQQLLKQTDIFPSKLFSSKIEDHSKPLRTALELDPHTSGILAQLSSSSGTSPNGYSLENNLLLFQGKIVVPDSQELKLNILQSRHDSQLAGHFGYDKTFKLVKCDFFWPGLPDFVKNDVASCCKCNRNKSLSINPMAFSNPFLFLLFPGIPCPWISLTNSCCRTASTPSLLLSTASLSHGGLLSEAWCTRDELATN